MTRSEIVALVRKLINDEQAAGFTEEGNLEEPGGTTELLNYLDRAVDEYSKRGAAAHDVRLLKRMDAVDGARLPEDFISFAGNAPVDVTGGVMTFYGYPGLPVRYFARLPYVTACEPDAELPWDYDAEMKIAALAAIYALNKHEYNVSQDLTLLGMGGADDGDAGQ